jgi:hypothetical protein
MVKKNKSEKRLAQKAASSVKGDAYKPKKKTEPSQLSVGDVRFGTCSTSSWTMAEVS